MPPPPRLGAAALVCFLLVAALPPPVRAEVPAAGAPAAAPEAPTPPPAAEGGSSAEGPDGALARGAELARRGRFEEAVGTLREASRGFASDQRPADQARALLRLAEAQQALGHYGDALRSLTEALPLAEASGDASLLAGVHGAAGNARIALGPPEAAREHLEKGLELARGAGDPALTAAILINLGNLRAAGGARVEALAAWREAAQLAVAAGRPDLGARALANAARVAEESREPPARARAQVAEARALAANLPASHDRAYLLISLGRTEQRVAAASSGEAQRQDLEAAHGLLREADEVAEAIGDPRAASYAKGYLGSLYEEHGRLDESLALTRRAAFQAQEAGAPESLYLWHWQAGRLLRARGEIPAAIQAYGQAVEVLQGIRHEMASGYATGGTSFREAVGPVFFELVDMLLREPSPAATQVAAEEQARLLRARETVELVKAAELRDYFRDECVDALQEKVETLDEVSKQAVVIYPITLPDRLELLLTFPPGVMRRVTVPVGAEELTAEVRAFRHLLEKRTSLEFLPHGQRLYEWLVRPFEAELEGLGVDTLVFVPDGALRTVPMAALHDGERFLVEKWALATTPGLSLTDPRALDRSDLKVFLGGLSKSVAGYEPLPDVLRELDSVRDLYGGERLVDETFALGRVRSTLEEQQFNVVHIASHGEFTQDVDESFLLTWDGRLTMQGLSDSVGLFKFRDTPIELLTLSACETAEGDDRAALGLAGVAIKAGARSALGTLWKVHDRAAADLMVSFYSRLKDPALSKAAALRGAQLQLLADRRYDHPGYWAPFLLISNWL